MTKKDGGRLLIVVNKNARRNYEIVDKLEAGISLKGSEVKSVRAGQVNIKEGYVRVLNGEAVLLGCHISPYQCARGEECEPDREKKLLLHKKEIFWLDEQLRKKGLAAVPLQIYFSNGRCKLEIGVGRGKKHRDQREDVKKREAERSMNRALRNK